MVSGLFKRKKLLMIILVLVLAVSTGVAATYFLWLKPNRVEPVGAQGFVKLPSPETKGTMSVEEAILKRRSIRSYADRALSLQDVSQLMWAAQGITDPVRGFRAAPSAGATYPLEVYVVVGKNGVTGLSEGVYHYDPYEHQLEYLLSGDLRSSLADAALGQEWVREAPISIVIVAIYERTTGRYGERGIRYVHMEAGHVGQNIYLQAVARGLGTVVVGAFYDDGVSRLLQLPGEQKPLYILPVGYPRG